MGNGQSSLTRREWDRVNIDFASQDDANFKEEELEGSVVIVRHNNSHADLKCFRERRIIFPLLLIENIRKKLSADQAVVLLENAEFGFTKSWQDIARRLKVPMNTRDDCKRYLLVDCDSSKRAMEECLDYWIKNDYEASWYRLIQVVACYERTTSENLREQLGLYTSDVHAKLKKECEEDFLDVLSKNKLTQAHHFQTLAPYLLCEAGERLVDEESNGLEEVSLKVRMLKMLQHWKDCWKEEATFEALICIVRKAFPFEPDIAEFIVSFVSGGCDLPSPIVQELPKFYKKMDEVDKRRNKMAYRDLKFRFSVFVSHGASRLCASTKARRTSFVDINCFVLSQLGQATVQSTAKNVEELMQFISQRVCWFNFEIFQNLIVAFGDEELKRDLDDYIAELEQYLNQSILHIPQTDCSRLQPTSHCSIVYLKIPDHESQMPNVYGLDIPEIKERLREHMDIKDQEQIEFKTHREGCVELVFAITGKTTASCTEWDEERQEYRITGNILEILPSSFCKRNRALSASLKEQLKTSDEESNLPSVKTNEQFENSGNDALGFSFSISGEES